MVVLAAKTRVLLIIKGSVESKITFRYFPYYLYLCKDCKNVSIQLLDWCDNLHCFLLCCLSKSCSCLSGREGGPEYTGDNKAWHVLTLCVWRMSSSSLYYGIDHIRFKKRKARFSFNEVHKLLEEVRKNRRILVGMCLMYMLCILLSFCVSMEGAFDFNARV